MLPIATVFSVGRCPRTKTAIETICSPRSVHRRKTGEARGINIVVTGLKHRRRTFRPRLVLLIRKYEMIILAPEALVRSGDAHQSPS